MQIFKKIFYKLPLLLKRLIIKVIEFVGFLYILIKINKIKIFKNNKKNKSDKKNILIYHISGLSFGGTEKNLQMITKYLDTNKYNVYLMHGTQTENNRLKYLENIGVTIIKFNYDSVEKKWPYFIKNMNPRIESVINQYNIDLIITATPGQSIYPILNIKKIPIILINIFGSFNTQKNIKKNIAISHEVKNLAKRIIKEDKLEVEYIPSERPIYNEKKIKDIRERFGINETDLVLGRIGRADDSIFDPVAILAFSLAVKDNPNLHYIIMSAPNLAKKLVLEKNIPNVHFLEASYLEEDIWSFHYSIDVLAHFRLDGESCGLNIIESMLVGNPILTHKSHIWNAQLEYLDPEFSMVAEKDDYKKYAENMLTMYGYFKNRELKKMGELAKKKAEEFFLIENVIHKYESLIDNILK